MKQPKLVYPRYRPKIIIPDGFTLIQDTREQKPLFKNCNHIITKGLKTGDYSIVGMEDMVCIERKTIPDLFGTLGKGRARFEKEIQRMLKMEWKGLLIEGTEDDTMRKQDWSQMRVESIYGSVCSMELHDVHIYYGKSKRDGQDWVLTRLVKFYEHVRKDKR